MPSFTKRLTVQISPKTHKRVKAIQARTGAKSQEAAVMLAIAAYERELDIRDSLIKDNK